MNDTLEKINDMMLARVKERSDIEDCMCETESDETWESLYARKTECDNIITAALLTMLELRRNQSK